MLNCYKAEPFKMESCINRELRQTLSRCGLWTELKNIMKNLFPFECM